MKMHMKKESAMMQEDYVWGDWMDGNGDVHPVRFKKRWGRHEFTEVEQRDLLSGKEIHFQYNGREITGHLQYFTFEDKQCFGFRPNFSESEYDPKPIYRDLDQRSTFELDLRKEKDIMSEYMRLNYYAKLRNHDGSQVDYKRIDDIREQRMGVDVTYTYHGLPFLIDEKAQMDYIYNEKPLPTFSLELLNGSSGAIGWFINDTLKTEYYMFIWPHAKSRPLSVEGIMYAYYVLINKEKLQIEIERRYIKNKTQLLEYARRMAKGNMGVAVYDKVGKCIGYRYKGDGFDDHGYLYYTLSKRERPVNLVVKRSWLEKIAKEYGMLK